MGSNHPIGASEPDPDWYVAECLRIAQERCQNRGLSLKSIAAELGTSRETLWKLFRSRVGLHFRRRLLDVRIAAALAVLERGGTPKEAAAVAGYSDLVHFNRDFRLKANIAPRQWQRDGGKSGLPEQQALGV